MVKRKAQSKIPWKTRKRFAGRRTTNSAAKSKTMSQKYSGAYTKGSVSQQFNRKQIRRATKTVKVSPRLTKAVKQISKKEAEKGLPVFFTKQIYAAKCTFAPTINSQGSITIPAVSGGGTTGCCAAIIDCNTLGSADELVAVLKKATSMVDADIALCKFKLLLAKKKYTYTNNTLAFINVVCTELEWKANDISNNFTSDATAYVSEMNGPIGVSIPDVSPKIAPQWNQKYNSKVSFASIPPGGQYTVELRILPQDVDFTSWDNPSTPLLPTGARGRFTQGLLMYGYYREAGNGTGTGASFGAVAATTANQLTCRVDTSYKFTAPSTMSEAVARDTWTWESTGDSTAITVLGSTFDRTAQKLTGNGN